MRIFERIVALACSISLSGAAIAAAEDRALGKVEEGTGTVVITATAEALSANPQGFVGEFGEYWLGLAVAPLPPALQSQLNLPKDQGLLVESVQAGSPAQKAGIQQYDVLMKANDKRLTTNRDLVELVNKVKEDKITLDLVRSGKHDTATATPAKRPVPTITAVTLTGEPTQGFHVFGPGQILPAGTPFPGGPGGNIVVTAVPFAASGMKAGVDPDIEHRLNEMQKQIDQLRKQLDAFHGKAEPNPK